MTCSVAAMLRS